jgi:tRNA dimethylallyltransferase
MLFSHKTGASIRPLIVIIGPTAAGKTDFSISLAEKVGGEIISADSRQFYKGMDIGTAKPSAEDQQRIPHHLIDIANPDDMIGLAEFQVLVENAAQNIWANGHIPLLVGGTGQYVRSILEGWSIPNKPPHLQLRSALENWARTLGPFEIHRRLRRIDPQAADFIQPQNVRRTVRALEVIFLSGQKFSELRRRQKPPYQTLMLGVIRSRPDLYARIDERIDKMVALGLLDEVRKLLQQGFSPNLPAFSAIGYKEMVAVIGCQISMDEAVILMKRRTREYVRRQANWFKQTDPTIHWLIPGSDMINEAVQMIDRFLRGLISATDSE